MSRKRKADEPPELQCLGKEDDTAMLPIRSLGLKCNRCNICQRRMDVQID